MPPSVIGSARDAELIHAAVIGTFSAQNLVNSGSVKIDLRRLDRGAWSSEWRLAFSERSVNRRCKVHRVAVAEYMHVHRERFVAQQVVVQRRHLNATLDEL